MKTIQQIPPIFWPPFLMGLACTLLSTLVLTKTSEDPALYWAVVFFGLPGIFFLMQAVSSARMRLMGRCELELRWGPVKLGDSFVALVRGDAVLRRFDQVNARLIYVGRQWRRRTNSRRSGSWQGRVIWDDAHTFAVRPADHLAGRGRPGAPVALIGFELPDRLPKPDARQRRFAWMLEISAVQGQQHFMAEFLIPGPWPNGETAPHEQAAALRHWPSPPDVEPLPAALPQQPGIDITRTPTSLRIHFKPRRSPIGMATTLVLFTSCTALCAHTALENPGWWLLPMVFLEYLLVWCFIISWFGHTTVEVEPGELRSTYADLRSPRTERATADEIQELSGHWGTSSGWVGQVKSRETWLLWGRKHDGDPLDMGDGIRGRAAAKALLEAVAEILGQGGPPIVVGLYDEHQSRELNKQERKRPSR